MSSFVSALLAASAPCFADEARSAGRPSRCGPAPPLGEPSEEARRVYEAAVDHTNKGQYEEALAAFQRAYDLSPSYVILLYIGKAAELTGDHARALLAYECHLEHGAAELDAKAQAEVTASINALKRKVGLVAIEVDEPGAKIMVDGALVGTSPLDEPIAVNPGHRLVRVEGTKRETRAIDVTAGASAVVGFHFKEPVEGPKFRFPGGLVGAMWITAGLMGVGTAVTGTLAILGAKDIEDDIYLGPSRTPLPGSDLYDKVDRANAFATASDVLLTLFIVTGATAVSFSIVNVIHKPKKDAPPPVAVAISPTGLSLQVALP